MKNLLKKLGLAAGLLALVVSPFVIEGLSAQAAFNSTAGGTYTLKSSISSTQTSITLTSFAEPVSDIPYTMSYLNTSVVYATINPEASNSEIISFTGITQNANGSASLTGVTRGLSRTPGTGGCVASSTLKQPFPGQTRLILSAPPCFYSQYPAKQNDETITGQWTFSVFPITPDSPAASETTAGISELSTAAEAAAGTSAGGTGFRLVLPGSLASSTWNSATAAGVVPVTGIATKKVDANFIATSTGLFANATMTGTTTLAGFTSTATTSSIGAFGAWDIGKQSQIITALGTSTFTVPPGITKVSVQICGAGGGGADASANPSAGSGGGAGGYAMKNVNVAGTSTIQVFVGTGGNGSGLTGTWTTFGTNGFYLIGNPGNGQTGGTASGGDINISGQSGVLVNGNTTAIGGSGGSSMFGFGGVAGVNTSGQNGTGYCSGGGGAQESGTGKSGGAGANGIVVIRW